MVVAFTVVVLSACAAGVAGVGPAIDDVRKVDHVDAVSAIDVSGALHVVVADAAPGGGPVVVVRAEKNLQPLVQVKVDGATLRVSMKGRPMSSEAITVTVRGLALRNYLLHGPVVVDASVGAAGRVKAVEVSAEGAARAVFVGAVGHLGVNARGAVLVDAFGVSADDVDVVVAGAARVNVGPAKALVVGGGGVAKVRYKGDPTLTTNVAPTVKVSKARP